MVYVLPSTARMPPCPRTPGPLISNSPRAKRSLPLQAKMLLFPQLDVCLLTWTMSWKISAVLPSCLPPPPHPLFRSFKTSFSQPLCLRGLLWLLSFPSLKSDSRFSFYLYLCFSSYLMVLFLYLTQIYRELILANFLMWGI